MTNRNKVTAEVFKLPPIIAFKQQQDLCGHLIRAKVCKAQKPLESRKIIGMKICKNPCTACPLHKGRKGYLNKLT